jgi:hypothetical protein
MRVISHSAFYALGVMRLRKRCGCRWHDLRCKAEPYLVSDTVLRYRRCLTIRRRRLSTKQDKNTSNDSEQREENTNTGN